MRVGNTRRETNMRKRNFFSFIGCFAAVISALCCATAFAEGASSAKTTSFGTLVLICAGIALLGIIAGIDLKATLIKVLFETDYSSSVSLVSLEKCAESLDRMSAVLSFVLSDSSV